MQEVRLELSRAWVGTGHCGPVGHLEPQGFFVGTVSRQGPEAVCGGFPMAEVRKGLRYSGTCTVAVCVLAKLCPTRSCESQGTAPLPQH